MNSVLKMDTIKEYQSTVAEWLKHSPNTWLGDHQKRWMDGWTDGRMDGWMDGWMDEYAIIKCSSELFTDHETKRHQFDK